MDHFFRICCKKFDQIFGSVENPQWGIDKSILTKFENPQLLISLLTVYHVPHKLNRWHRQTILLEMSREIIQQAIKTEPREMSRRLLPVFAEAYPLVLKYLPEERKAYSAMLRNFADYMARCVLMKKDLTQLTSANIGYGTNHLAVELRGLCAYEKYCAATLGNLRGIHKAFLKEFLKKFMAYMNPNGYWAECDGPALLYNSLTGVSLLYLAQMLGEFPKYQKQFEAVADFHALVTLPNNRYIDVLDGRNANASYDNRGAFLTLTSAGLAVYDKMVALMDVNILTTPSFGEYLQHLLKDEQTRLQMSVKKKKSIWSAKNVTRDLGDFLILKNDTWIMSASKFLARPRPEGHFNNDYQSIFSLYHVDFGEIFGGQNSKNDPEIATFSKFMNTFDGAPVQKPMPKYIPGNGFYEYQNKTLTVMRDYRGFEGILSAKMISSKKIEILIQVHARTNEYPVQCNFILPSGINAPFLNEKRQPVALKAVTQKKFKRRHVGKHIYLKEKAGLNILPTQKRNLIKINIPEQAEILWPFKPWDHYNLESDRALDPEKWYTVLVVHATNTPVKLILELVPEG